MENNMELDLDKLKDVTGGGELWYVPTSIKNLIESWVYIGKILHQTPKEDVYVNIKRQLDRMAKNLIDEDVLRACFEEFWKTCE